ncbi:MAG: hypothetical protein ACR2I9_01270 [Candidatus Nanopelagicaceae bacterium]|jgi:hypothetical protein
MSEKLSRTLTELVVRKSLKRLFDMLAATRPSDLATSFALNWATQFATALVPELLNSFIALTIPLISKRILGEVEFENV